MLLVLKQAMPVHFGLVVLLMCSAFIICHGSGDSVMSFVDVISS